MGTVRLTPAQDRDVPTFRPQRRRKVEIVEPAGELETAAELDQGQELLREEDLGRDPAFDAVARAVVADVERDELVVGLGDRIDQLGTVSHAHADLAAPSAPAPPVVAPDLEPHDAVE